MDNLPDQEGEYDNGNEGEVEISLSADLGIVQDIDLF
jgi:hypothetical protein